MAALASSASPNSGGSSSTARFNAERIEMLSPARLGLQRRHLGGVVLRIMEWDVREAINLSVALKRPERSFGAIIDSRASSFTDGSARVYISVVCM